MPVESGVKRLREQEFDWAVEQKRVQILLDTTVSGALAVKRRRTT